VLSAATGELVTKNSDARAPRISEKIARGLSLSAELAARQKRCCISACLILADAPWRVEPNIRDRD
jgi:hypothetical protein